MLNSALLAESRSLSVSRCLHRPEMGCREIVIITFLWPSLAYLTINTRRQERLSVQPGSRVTVVN